MFIYFFKKYMFMQYEIFRLKGYSDDLGFLVTEK